MSEELDQDPSVQAVMQWLNAGAVTAQQPDAETLQRVLSVAFALEQERDQLRADLAAAEDAALRNAEMLHGVMRNDHTLDLIAERDAARRLVTMLLEYGTDGLDYATLPEWARGKQW